MTWRWVVSLELLGETDDYWLYQTLDPQGPTDTLSLRKSVVGDDAPIHLVLVLEDGEALDLKPQTQGDRDPRG